MDAYLEIGKKRTFAGAVDWPGWSRSGRDEESALQALFDYAPRYARVVRTAQLGFEPPIDPATFTVVERLKGDTTTDFGTPGMAPSSDARPVDSADLERFQKLLKACWRRFDSVVGEAKGKELRKGPRGGGRELEAIVDHVRGADQAYLARIGWKIKQDEAAESPEQLRAARREILQGLAAASRGELPTRGPRGSVYWSPRYFVRRVAWHVLDHAWEIEDRTTGL